MILGERSRQNLVGVHPDLVRVVERAAEICAQPFDVAEGLRSKRRQRYLIGTGASTTMNSRHITGHAVDLVPLEAGRLCWDWDRIYPVAEAVRMAAREIDVRIRWGGCWDAAFDLSTSSAEDMVSGYVDRRKAQGKRAFIDGPHFELPKAVYP